MKTILKILLGISIFSNLAVFSQANPLKKESDSIPLKYHFKNYQQGNLFLKKPTNKTVTYDEVLGKFVIVEKIGNIEVGTPLLLSKIEYDEYKLKNDMSSYFKEKFTNTYTKNAKNKKNLLPTYYVNSKFFESIFGGNKVEVKLNGQVSIKMGILYQKTENPNISIENQSNLTFDFDQQIGAGLQAQIGKRLKVSANYDTQATFDFQNNIIKLEYTPDEDDILQKLDAGNVNLPIRNSLINGAQALFGVRADLQFGRTTVRTAISQQNSQAKTVVTEGGAMVQPFEFRATDYDNDRHFFLSHFFRESYSKALQNYPLVSSPINITRVEVWVTNRNQSVKDFRSIVAFADLGESNSENTVSPVTQKQIATVNVGGKNFILPSNQVNNLDEDILKNPEIRKIETLSSAVGTMKQGLNYTYLQNARKLQENEFTFHPQLGYISLNSRLYDGEILAVAYEYTVVGASNGETVFKVGEFSNDGVTPPSNIAVKLLRSEILTTTRPNDKTKPFPTWQLMMKNVYALGSSALKRDGFRFELMYRDDDNGLFLNTLQNAKEKDIRDKILLNLMNLDKLDQSQFAVEGGDGFFDYVEGITVNSDRGLIFFPETEPFGKDLKEKLKNSDDQKKYVFDKLYLTTKIQARNEYQNKDKYYFKGYYKSESSGGISLGFNIPRGSVRVSAGGRQLVEGIDYTVDYQMGKVKILDPSLEASGVPITARVENNTFFNQQRKTFFGVDVEHKISDDFILGGTFVNVTEKPITPKINYGAEPISNVILGANFEYGKEIPYLTRLANYLPFVETEAPSNISVRGDFAYLIPGSPSGIDVNGTATSYVDDFETSQVPINLSAPSLWYLASTPLNSLPTDDFKGDKTGKLEYNDRRAKLAWYNVDQLFYSNTSNLPDNVNEVELSRDEVRRVAYSELFPNTDLDITQLNMVRTLDLAYYPNERGPYNFNENAVFSDGKVNLNEPEKNWGGIMRPLTTNNFEQSNIEYVQFWLLDPYDNYSITEKEGLPKGVDPKNVANQVGHLRIDLGNISEDILSDGFKQYENGLTPKSATQLQSTVWGKVPKNPSIFYTFSNDKDERLKQDVGLNGLNDSEEKVFDKYPSQYKNLSDPAGDNFHFFRGSDLDSQNASILTRYKNYNGTEGNSPAIDQSKENYPTSSTSYPDTEDINRDQTMNTTSGYFEYDISMNKSDLVLGQNYIVDVKTENVTLPTGATRQAKWYQFRIPIRNGNAKIVGGISDFNSIRFMRMYLTGFKIPVVLRFGELQLVGGDWRRYTRKFENDTEQLDNTQLNNFEVGVASIEQNNATYVMPPGISRELLQGTNRIQRQNEQAVTIKVNDLPSKETRSIYKNIEIDLRRYKNLRMFIHAEAPQGGTNNDEINVVVRLGTDLNDNYYEVEKPLKLSTKLLHPSSEDAWPTENNLDLLLTDLSNLKLKRDGANISAGTIYEASSSNGLKIKVKGNPTLAKIRTFMLGVKNNTATQKTAEVWFNELRSVGFDNEGGWASILSADANLADVANLSVAGSMSTVGFGSVEKRVQERSLEETKEYSVATTVQLGKMMPKKWNMQIPMSYTYGEQFRNPKYNPQYQDIEQEKIINSPNKTIRKKANNAEDYTKRKGISFINVKKNRNPESKKKPRFYDIENIAVSYAYNEEFHKDYNIKSYVNKNLNMGASYNFSFSPMSFSPFQKMKIFKKKHWRLIKDFNINLLPSKITLDSKLSRNYNSQQSRNLIEGLTEQPVLTQRRYMFDWNYSIGYNLTRSLQFNFTAKTNRLYDSFGKNENLEIFDQLNHFGRKNNYHQTLNGSYKIPIDKIPFLGFIRANYGFTTDFDWKAASKSPVFENGVKIGTIEDKVGNMIQNANTHQLNLNMNFARLYKELGLRKLSKKSKTAYNILTSIKTAKVSFSQNNGTMLQGYKPSVGFLGRTNYGGSMAPSLGFVFGSQTDILNKALQHRWLVSRNPSDQYFNQVYNKISSTKLNYSLSVKPINSLTITIRGNKIQNNTLNSQIDVINSGNSLKLNDKIQAFETGDYSSSYFMLGTIFTNNDVLFDRFKANRLIIAKRLAKENGLSASQDEKTPGYKISGQQVLLPAFLASYSGDNPNKVNTGLFRNIPSPNWNLRFNGLMKYKWFKKNFSSFTLSHGYKSSYTLANYTNNLQYRAGGTKTNLSNNYEPEKIISTATLIDEFSPLIKVDFKMRNSFSFNGLIRKDRSLSMNFSNNVLTEIKGTEYSLGLGYRLKDVKFTTRITGKKTTLKGDVNFNLNLSLRNNLTMLRAVDEDNNQITGGENLFGLKFNADYNLNENLTASFYYNHNSFSYAISTAFPRLSINAGINLIYRLN